MTGEEGPELKFETRSGYVANNRAMRQLASFAERIQNAAPQSTQSANLAAGGSGGVVQQITNHFHANGISADELISIAERRLRSQASGALYDRAGPVGAFGG